MFRLVILLTAAGLISVGCKRDFNEKNSSEEQSVTESAINKDFDLDEKDSNNMRTLVRTMTAVAAGDESADFSMATFGAIMKMTDSEREQFNTARAAPFVTKCHKATRKCYSVQNANALDLKLSLVKVPVLGKVNFNLKSKVSLWFRHFKQNKKDIVEVCRIQGMSVQLGDVHGIRFEDDGVLIKMSMSMGKIFSKYPTEDCDDPYFN